MIRPTWVKIQRLLAPGDAGPIGPAADEAESVVSKKTSGNTATPGEAVLYRKYTTKKKAISRNASSDSTWCSNGGDIKVSSIAYSTSATKWKTAPSPTAGSMMAVNVLRLPHRVITA